MSELTENTKQLSGQMSGFAVSKEVDVPVRIASPEPDSPVKFPDYLVK